MLVGHSMGGLIAARYAQRHGDGLAALVLSGPVVGTWEAAGQRGRGGLVPADVLPVAVRQQDDVRGGAVPTPRRRDQAAAVALEGPFPGCGHPLPPGGRGLFRPSYPTGSAADVVATHASIVAHHR